MAFTHLHLHTEYSLLDGACRINEVFSRAKELGQNSLAITDHGVMYGVINFYKEAKKHDIKPIIGCEVYVAARTRHDKVHGYDNERYHLILLCENEVGYKNLIAMVSESWTSGFYTKPRVDKELLEKHHEGLIALSACLAGEVAQALLKNEYEEAKRIALWYRDVFGEDNYFLEIQNHSLKEQLAINPLLIRLSKETGIPLVATNDAHYIKKEDSKVQQVLICIQTNHMLGENTGLEFETDEFYLKSEEEMLSLFPECPEAVSNTALIAERCNLEFEFGNTKLPHFEVPDNRDHFEWFREQCYNGLYERYGENPPQSYIERLDYELDVINKMGYVDYYLIVHDFIRFAKSQDIPVGPGRGSGAGSIAAYCIGITGIDPMKYSLLFERFLNPERVSMPDFDIDFCYERRPEVIDYVIRKYGADHVAQIVTFGTMAAKGAIRDVGRVMGIPYNTVDNVAKQVPSELNITLDSALKKSVDFKALYDSDDKIRELIDMARKVEGMPRHTSTHAAGVVITRDPVASYVPLALNDESAVTQFTMTTLEELGLLKMDFLGLRTLTVIDDAQNLIRQSKPDFNINDVSLEDKDVFDMLSKGNTVGVFQFESAGMRSVLTGLGPESLEDLIAVISLYRPGPMDSIPTYIENRHNPEKVKYKTPLLADILDVTYGCMVYQEQVMQIFRKLAGYSYGRADIVRRAMSKKKHDVMAKERTNFVHGMVRDDGTVECVGAVKNGVPEDVANQIFDDMSSFASYAFNKSHAAAYAYVAYQTAWLKCHYPCEFLAALLSSVLDSSDKVSEYIAECLRLGIEVLPPSVNSSMERFTVNDGKIRFGMLAVKNLGKGFIREIISEREKNGEYTSFYSFCKRLYGHEFNRRAVESLIKSGSLDISNVSRNSMLASLPDFIGQLDNEKKRNLDGQIGFFDLLAGQNQSAEPKITELPEFSHTDKLNYEKEVTGIYLSGHPMSQYAEYYPKIKADGISELSSSGNDFNSPYKDNAHIKVLGIITSVKKKITRNDTTIAFITVEDMSGSIEAIVFSKLLEKNPLIYYEGAVVVINGRLSLREDEDAKIVCETVEIFSPDTYADAPSVKTDYENKPQAKKSGRNGLFLKFSDSECAEKITAEKFLRIFEGNTPLYYYFIDSKKYVLLPAQKWVEVNEPLLHELKGILGDENVVFRE